jgi:molybdopterin-dependent oxidoreductase alpha subunit
MLRRKKDRGFTRIAWPEAFEWITRAIRASAPNQMGFLATSRGLTNEVYYVFQKLARSLGTNNLDLCSGLFHATSVSGLKDTLGLGASTCSLSDLIGTDLLVLFGTELANEPVTIKYLRFARQQGTRIIVIDPMSEYGPDGSWLPAAESSPLSGARLIDDTFQVQAGGDIAFINGALKALLNANRLDDNFVARHTIGIAELKQGLAKQSWDLLERRSGVARADMERFARIYGGAHTAVLVYSMALTQHEFGIKNVESVVNLALARGMLGREKCGIMPIRGQSGVQGASECGLEPDKFPGDFSVNQENARRFTNLWRHPVPSAPGLDAVQMIEAAHRGEIKFLYSIGGNLLETILDRGFVVAALGRVPIRVHQDVVLNSSMLLDAEEAVLLLPAQTRYEQRGGGISTSTERRIRFTPEIPGHQIGETLPGWEIPALIGRKAMSNGELLFPFNDTQSIREEMARVMPMYQGIEKLAKEGDQLQWGGPLLYIEGFTNMSHQRARFTVLEPPDPVAQPARFGSPRAAANSSGL